MSDYHHVLDRLESVRRRFLEMLPARVEHLQELSAGIADPAQCETSLTQASFEAHKIAGTAGTLGFPRLGQLAAGAEAAIGQHIVARGRTPAPGLKAMIDELIAEGARVIAL
jgi:HPt (histidine-containing phosphotransfer) domain-containing protein